MNHLGNTIKAFRESYNMSQEELGKRIGVKRAAVNKYEKGTVENIPIKTIEKLANIFDTTPSYLIGWDENGSHSTYEARVIRGVSYFFGNPSVEMLNLFGQLDKEGQRKCIQYMNDLSKIHKIE